MELTNQMTLIVERRSGLLLVGLNRREQRNVLDDRGPGEMAT